MRHILLLIILLVLNVALARGEVNDATKNLSKIPPGIAVRHAELAREINRHNDLYYNRAAPEISDAQYDSLKDELLSIESNYPALITKESPSQQVGAPVENDNAASNLTDQTSSKKVAHLSRMLSLEKVHDVAALQSWCEKIEKKLAASGLSAQGFVVEPKIDGVAVSLVYEAGKLTRIVTRGDGNFGEDITPNVRKYVASINQAFEIAASLSPAPEFLEVRGEVYLPRDNKSPVSNARNIVAGKMRANLAPNSDHHPNDHTPLAFMAYQIVGGKIAETQAEVLPLLENDFALPVNQHNRLCANAAEVVTCVREWQSLRDTFSYDTDGVVIKVNNLAAQKFLGESATAPAWALAYKFPATQAETHIEAIRIQIGKSGVLTPVAEVAPTKLNGAMITRVSLHNFDFVAKHDLRVGDCVLIERAGEVIPRLVKNFPEQRAESEKNNAENSFAIPTHCPSCNTPCVRRGVAIFCPNTHCAGQLRERLLHFASRDAMRFTGFGPATIDKLMARDLLHNVADFFTLTPEQLTSALGLKRSPPRADSAEVEKFPKSVIQLCQSIEAGKSRGLAAVLTALAIPQIGTTRAVAIAEKFGSMEAIMNAALDDLAATPCGTANAPRTLGKAAAQSLYDFFAQDKNRELITRLAEYGVVMEKR